MKVNINFDVGLLENTASTEKLKKQTRRSYLMNSLLLQKKTTKKGGHLKLTGHVRKNQIFYNLELLIHKKRQLAIAFIN